MNTSKEYIGTCTICGTENQKLTIVDEETHVCPHCLDADFFYCEQCHEYWMCGAVEDIELEDGRTVCEYCAEDIEDEE
jgi:formylmethanofuran dehydrogenase subunit E